MCVVRYVGGEIMATSSIVAGVMIDTPEAAEQLLTAMEQSAAGKCVTVSVPLLMCTVTRLERCLMSNSSLGQLPFS